MQPNFTEMQSRERVEKFLAEAEHDHMVELARSASSDRPSQRLRYRLAELLVIIAVRLEPALLLYSDSSRMEPRMRAARH